MDRRSCRSVWRIATKAGTIQTVRPRPDNVVALCGQEQNVSAAAMATVAARSKAKATTAPDAPIRVHGRLMAGTCTSYRSVATRSVPMTASTRPTITKATAAFELTSAFSRRKSRSHERNCIVIREEQSCVCQHPRSALDLYLRREYPGRHIRPQVSLRILKCQLPRRCRALFRLESQWASWP